MILTALLAIIYPPLRRPDPEPQTHELELGACCQVVGLSADRMQVNLQVFGHYNHIDIGDYLILRYGKATTRYRLDRIWHPDDPGDQYFFYCSFAPRKCKPKP